MVLCDVLNYKYYSIYSGDNAFSLFLRKAFIKGAEYTDAALEQPIIGIVDTSSGFNPCHGNVHALIRAVGRGVLLKGALPITFPTISLHESFAIRRRCI